MVGTTIPGMPDYSGNAIPSPTFSSMLAPSFIEGRLLSVVANNDYQGNINEKGDTVRVRDFPFGTAKTYARGQSVDLDYPDITYTEVKADQQIYHGFAFNSIDEWRSDLALQELAAQRISDVLAVSAERTVLNGVAAQLAAANVGATAGALTASINMGVAGTPVSLTNDNIEQKFADARQVMTEANIPLSDCCAIVDSQSANMITQGNLGSASYSGDGVSISRDNNLNRRIANFDVYQSNLISYVTDVAAGSVLCGTILFLHKSCLSFVNNFTAAIAERKPLSLELGVWAVNVFGSKVIAPTAGTALYYTKG